MSNNRDDNIRELEEFRKNANEYGENWAEANLKTKDIDDIENLMIGALQMSGKLGYSKRALISAFFLGVAAGTVLMAVIGLLLS